MAESVNRSGPSSVHALAVAALDRNDAAQAEALLAQTLAAAPDDAIALQLMGVVRRMQGQYEEAERCYRRSIACDPAQPQVHHNLGTLLRLTRRFADAAEAFREAIRLKSNYVEPRVALALTLSDLGDHEGAEKCCRQALHIQPGYRPARQALATELNALGRTKDAEQILRQMLLLGGMSARMTAEVEFSLGDSLRLQGRFKEALVLFAAARTRFPGLPAVDYVAGNTLRLMGRFDEAIEAFQQALALDSDNAEILALAAFTAAQADDFAAARKFAERAMARIPRHGLAAAVVAASDISARDFDAAQSRIRAVLDDPKNTGNDLVDAALNFAADMFDRCREFRAAFALYGELNERRRLQGLAMAEVSRLVDETQGLRALFENSGHWNVSPPSRPSRRMPAGHVFVLGFMRSGTTLLTASLARHRDVVAIDERELLLEPTRAFFSEDFGFQRLAAIDGDEIARWRDAYWNSVHAAGFRVAGKVFVDKMPFNSIRLPLIARLFPNAKVVFAVRDPRDVVFSCFRRRFDMTPYSFEFLRLDDCAQFYASVMALAQSYRERLPLTLRDVRYEDVVGSFEPTLRSICDFIGLDWQDTLLNSGDSGDAVDPRSASAAQVRREIYGDVVGAWRNYRAELAPILPILQPWISALHYSAA
jgi:Tfp pilus assembly protein PilF